MTLTKNYKKPTETMKSVSKWYRLREIWMSSWKGLDSRYKPKGGASKGDSYWHMLVESVNMVRDLLKNNRELREQT
jgi:hypothetical protein